MHNIFFTAFIPLLFLLAAAAIDLHSRRIPNALLCCGITAGLFISYMLGGKAGLTQALGGCTLPPALLWPVYRYRMLGAGDLKMLAMAGTFAGYRRLPQLFLTVFLAGGLISLLLMLQRGILLKRFARLAGYIREACISGRPGVYPQDGPEAEIRFSVPVLLGFALISFTL